MKFCYTDDMSIANFAYWSLRNKRVYDLGTKNSISNNLELIQLGLNGQVD